MKPARPPGKLDAADARHRVIGHQQIDALSGLENCERPLAGGCFEGIMAKVLDHIDRAHRNQRIVFNDQDGCHDRRFYRSANRHWSGCNLPWDEATPFPLDLRRERAACDGPQSPQSPPPSIMAGDTGTSHRCERKTISLDLF